MKASEITPREFNQLHRDAVKLYCDAVWNLADLLKIGKEKFGRKRLLEMSNLPKNKIDWFIAVAELSYRTNQLPELHYETCSVPHGKRWLKKAQQEGLKPTQLRQEIRKARSDFHRKPKVLDTSKWLASLLSIERELKNFNGDRIKAAQRLKPLVDLYNQYNTSGV